MALSVRSIGNFTPLLSRRSYQTSSRPNLLTVTAVLGTLWATHSREDDPTKCHGGPPTYEQNQKFYELIKPPLLSKINSKELPVYSSQEVAKRNGQDGQPTWMSYGGYVYDVTKFIPFHPGGTERISRAAGAAIEPFWYLHQQHFDSEEPMQIMQNLRVGKLDASDQAKVDEQLEKLQEEVDRFRLELDLSKIGKGVFSLSLDDLKKLPKKDRKSQVGCTQNQDRRPVSSSIFGGVRMEELLGGKAIRKITFYAMDGEMVAFEVENYQDILVCYEMDGAPLTQGRGFPLRAIVPGKRVVKWVQKIEVDA